MIDDLPQKSWKMSKKASFNRLKGPFFVVFSSKNPNFGFCSFYRRFTPTAITNQYKKQILS